MADTDTDGQLSVGDHVRWTGSLMSLAAVDARQMHRRLDSGGDGRVTADHLVAAIRAYCFDEAPDSAGSRLLGQLDV
ncbi:hypothetical protein [Streptomyces sp. NPDC008122]|uniref:hypothetical protein n=1 Tax=Streptomyces sp. NPDC008122 TaxID=3364810 RepID=UPI0036E0452C